MIFMKYFCTNWYKKSLKEYKEIEDRNYTKISKNLEESLKKTQLPAEANYYLKNDLLFSLIQIKRSLLIDKISTNEKDINDEQELVWQTVLLVLFSELVK